MIAGRPALAGLLALSAGLAACGPVPVAQAERSCMEDARAATGPRSEVALGIGTDGHRVRPMSSVEISVSSDYVMGRDPSDVFNRCVMRRSGQFPTRPLAQQPGWRG
ncbi:MAG TPA: hypothetical protein PLL33_06365 [Paracoccus sp. (in: a-proteobacteria)]|nr:hypothetical protein [Paracoccus sp. (in: a-proteobacteria)]